ncbi:NUDIX hydrolase [Brevibacillus composti]|uniref:NUDIX hydrolase n=1 Tax=Brevibacillus composti TaxID=2796470 RepID=A0A7T5ENE0_9BACL|nr:NUDIX domain-containing protein [Brevibacillus composti]QQE75785.1 NUDIX hydrolase [Brevibacillus composti]QUO42811.1 NUDIX hydrolase [Brevibacillus composti]
MTTQPSKRTLAEQQFLEEYDVNQYIRPSVSVDMLLFTVVDEETENYRKRSDKALKILLIKRKQHPFQGQWALPGGFVSADESIDEAAIRVLQKETNVSHVYLEQLYTWGDIGRDPRTRVISCSYMALINSELYQVRPGEDADDAQWFHVQDQWTQKKTTVTDKGFMIEKWVELRLWNETDSATATIKLTKTVENSHSKEVHEIIDSSNLAFDHAKMILYALERLRNKVEYTDIAFHLLPELFTLSDLQQVFEVILGKELLAAAFRRKIADKVLETNHIRRNAGHRPSKLYKYNPNWNHEQ